jgi:hypothetical protein
LGNKNNAKKRKFHEAGVMHIYYIDKNVISWPSLDIPPLWHSMLMDEKKKIIKERKPRKQVDNRVKPAARKRSKESDTEGKEGNRLIRIDKQANIPAVE